MNWLKGGGVQSQLFFFWFLPVSFRRFWGLLARTAGEHSLQSIPWLWEGWLLRLQESGREVPRPCLLHGIVRFLTPLLGSFWLVRTEAGGEVAQDHAFSCSFVDVLRRFWLSPISRVVGSMGE